jgi:hypothetical protein
MKKITLIILNVIIVAFLMSSCATILTGSKDSLTFNSTPSGAIIYKDGLELCKTPCNIRMKRSLSDVQVEFKLEGYQTRVITLDTKFNAVSIINLGNLLGWGIDAATGTLMKYDRKGYDIELTKDKTVSSIHPDKIYIDTKKKTVDVYTR